MLIRMDLYIKPRPNLTATTPSSYSHTELFRVDFPCFGSKQKPSATSQAR